MKIAFLDIDGVFNSEQYACSDEYKAETAGMSDAHIMLIAHHLHLDPKAILLFNDLVERSGCKVVLSSTWREKYTVDEMNNMLAGRGATFKIIDRTPKIIGKFSEVIPRGKEINEYLNSLKEVPESFVIIDDYDDMLHLKPFLVRTNVEFGLTQNDVERALQILNR